MRSNFSEAGEVLDGLGIRLLDGALLDLGVSSRHLDAAERGFSFMREGSLDMRMDTRGLTTAADLVNTLSGGELERIFREFGEERAARRIAERIVRERAVRPPTGTPIFFISANSRTMIFSTHSGVIGSMLNHEAFSSSELAR